MTKLEKSILNLLKEDARYTASQLAVMLASDEETVAKTISSLEKKV